MYYCYYQSCNYTLTDKKGVFQSPGFPGKYPDGQLCSWRIMVPDNHTVRVHFTHFSLDENDTQDVLEWYKSINSSFQLKETLHGFIQPFTLTETSDLLFKFVSNEEGHTLGFRAEYTVFIPGETTLEPPSSTPEASNSPTTNTNTPIPTEHISEITTESTMSRNRTAFALEAQCKGVGTIVVIVIPLACVVFVVIVIIIVVYRYRLARSKGEKKEERIEDKIAANPIYDQGDILLTERGSITTINTTMDFNGGQMYQTLSHDQKTTTNDEYHSDCQMYQSLSRDQKPGCDGRKEMDDPSTDFGRPTYHELEPVDHKVPDVVYGVLEGPDPNDGPSGDQVYQAVDENTTHEPFYQYTAPGTMVTQNHLYDSFT
ncbi:uncharacterized protein LOC116301292 [Actinia tenebrosa]|uniref:Uncharacterized protein LOC116301292 n=1 Tax=Actinia tenebrosa TaxID=6105 RepID=A0A6P8IHN8_ACTTE|nr:uncharacterized protein LOC116301292 [Actinia tenebrosa]